LRKGKLKPVEFRLRASEHGLSLFEFQDRTVAQEIIETVRAAGKQGELAVALIDADAIRSLGLILVRTRGATSSERINDLHIEARLPFLRKLLLFLRGIRHYDYFNEELSAKLCALARLLN
jgi:hypothetical protein